jgi:hypothetical protein
VLSLVVATLFVLSFATSILRCTTMLSSSIRARVRHRLPVGPGCRHLGVGRMRCKLRGPSGIGGTARCDQRRRLVRDDHDRALGVVEHAAADGPEPQAWEATATAAAHDK